MQYTNITINHKSQFFLVHKHQLTRDCHGHTYGHPDGHVRCCFRVAVLCGHLAQVGHNDTQRVAVLLVHLQQHQRPSL